MTLIVQTCGVVGTLLAATIAVRSYLNSNKRTQETRDRELETRQAQLFMSIYQATYTKDFEEAVEAFYWKFRDLNDYISMIEDPQRSAKFSTYGMWFEGQGVLVREGLIDVKMVAELCGGIIVMWWSSFGPFILGYRKINNPRHFIEAEYLYNKVVEYGKGHPELMIPLPKST